MEILNLPRADQLDVMNTLLASIASNQEGGITVKSWKDVQTIVRMGLAPVVFRIGDRFVANYDDTPFVWEVAGFDMETAVNPDRKHTMTILPVDCLENRQFSARQAFYNAKSGLDVGTYVFTLSAGIENERNYKFTTTVAIPEGGVIAVSSWDVDSGYHVLKVTTYEADRTTAIESGIDVSETSDASTISPINQQQRVRYGSNNYKESSIRHWLNSDADNWKFVAQTDYDMPPTSAYPTAGFLKRLDSDLVDVLVTVEKQVARNNVTDEGGQDIVKDKVFLLSRVEVGLGTEGTTTGEKVYPLYENATNADRIKLLGASTRYWWLRSPHVGNARTVRSVHTSGGLDIGYALDARGLVPACPIG